MSLSYLLAFAIAAQYAPPQSKWEPPQAEHVKSLAESAAAAPRDLLTRSELSDYRETGRYAEAVEFARKLEKRSPWVQVQKIGTTPQGRDMIMLVVSRDRAFTPEAAARTGKPVIFIQNGIHPGEIAGKDATFMLLRDVVISKRFASWLDHVILLVLPVFNIDGHERMSPHNRINQNGPAEMGWRTTAQGLNLNRDYMKADAPEMRAFLKIYTSWLPELLIDNHVTDGADYRYDVTIGVPTEQEIWPSMGQWSRRLLDNLLAGLEEEGHVASRYAEPRTYGDFSKGLIAWGSWPRFSTGYAAIQNRAGLLVETHSLKRYRTRVWAHYDVMRRAIEFVAQNNTAVKQAAAEADREIVRQAGRTIFVGGEAAEGGDPFVYKGLSARMEKSDLTGGFYPVFGKDAVDLRVPLSERVRPFFEPVVPAAYAVPREWKAVLDLLAAHGVRTERLERKRNAKVEVYRFKDVRWSERPYESRHTLTFKTELSGETLVLPEGMVLVPANQRAIRVAVNLLEPDGPDAAVRWGFFDTIFEQKEYAEPYIIEPLAKRMIENDQKLREEFEARLKSDPKFAASVQAKRQFFFERSPYFDRNKDRYPVLRVMAFE